jgi:hypothetical protein
MKNFKKFFIEMVLPFILAWFFMTILVDIITIPTVFRNSSNIVEAGKIGMTVFERFNSFEMCFSVFIMIGSYFYWKTYCNRKWFYFAGPLFILTLVYKFYMTPLIINTTIEIQATNVLDPMYAVLQSRHAQYHNFYRNLDTMKLIFLLIFGGKVLFDKIKNKSVEVCE